jgi:hypothetical protein
MFSSILSTLSNLFGAVGSVFDFLKQKKLSDVIEEKKDLEYRVKYLQETVQSEKKLHKRTKDLHKIEEIIENVP